jgi:hypothetical protein
MDDGEGPGGLTFLCGPTPSAFEVRVVSLPPGREIPFVETEWRRSLVVVERGELELVAARGAYGRFLRGDVLCLVGLGLRALRGRGGDPTVLAVVRRRGAEPQPRR